MPLCKFGDSHVSNKHRGPLRMRRNGKKASLFPLLQAPRQVRYRALKKEGMAASMTLEAALILPIWLFFFGTMIMFINMVRVEGSMLAALYDVGTTTCEYQYFLQNGLDDVLDGMHGYDADDEEAPQSSEKPVFERAVGLLLSETYVRDQVEEHLTKEYLDHCHIIGGAGGISYLQSTMDFNTGKVNLVADYRMGVPFTMFGDISFWMQNRFVGHAWTGYDDGGITKDGQNEEMVYIVPNGTVYHRDIHCTHLMRNMTAVDAAAVDQLRNNDGGKYYPCEICKPQKSGTLLITGEGNRYHRAGGCSSLLRTVLTVPLSSVEGSRGPCSKCGG